MTTTTAAPDVHVYDVQRPVRPALRIHAARPSKDTGNPTLVFVHGAFSGGWMWAHYFQPFFAEHGFASVALDLRGRRSVNPMFSSHLGLVDYMADVEDAIAHVDGPFVLIGHSLGGLISQRVCATQRALGLGLVASVPPEGLALSSWQMAVSNPFLFWNTTAFAMSPSMGDVSVARSALLSADVPTSVAKEMLRRSNPEPPRALMEAQLPMPERPGFLGDMPVCVLGADNDKLIPFSAVERTADFYGVDAHKLEDTAHAVMIDTRWRQAAETLLDWIAQDILGR